MSVDVKILNRELLHQGDGRLERIRYAFERRKGGQIEIEEDYLYYGHSVAVLPIDRTRKTALVVRQVRVPVLLEGDGEFILEACAGMIDPCDNDDRSAAIDREAMEELGCHLHDKEEIAHVFLTPGCVGERIGLFLASYTEADRINAGGGTDDDEDVEVLELPLSELGDLVRTGAIKDASLMILAQNAMIRYPELF